MLLPIIKEAKEGAFPAAQHKYGISGDPQEFDNFFSEIEADFKK